MAVMSEFTDSICADNALGRKQINSDSKNMGDKMLNDVLANMLSAIKNSERAGKEEVMFRPVSTLSTGVLKIMKDGGYIQEFEAIEDGRGGIYRIILGGKINDCNVVKPRFPIRKGDHVKWERRFLPAEGFGIIVVSTSQGLMTLAQAKKKEIGGRLISFVY